MSNVMSSREWAAQLVDFISRASKRRIEWRGDWISGSKVTPMDDKIGELIEGYVQARIAAHEVKP